MKFRNGLREGARPSIGHEGSRPSAGRLTARSCTGQVGPGLGEDVKPSKPLLLIEVPTIEEDPKNAALLVQAWMGELEQEKESRLRNFQSEVRKRLSQAIKVQRQKKKEEEESVLGSLPKKVGSQRGWTDQSENVALEQETEPLAISAPLVFRPPSCVGGETERDRRRELLSYNRSVCRKIFMNLERSKVRRRSQANNWTVECVKHTYDAGGQQQADSSITTCQCGCMSLSHSIHDDDKHFYHARSADDDLGLVNNENNYGNNINHNGNNHMNRISHTRPIHSSNTSVSTSNINNESQGLTDGSTDDEEPYIIDVLSYDTDVLNVPSSVFSSRDMMTHCNTKQAQEQSKVFHHGSLDTIEEQEQEDLCSDTISENLSSALRKQNAVSASIQQTLKLISIKNSSLASEKSNIKLAAAMQNLTLASERPNLVYENKNPFPTAEKPQWTETKTVLPRDREGPLLRIFVKREPVVVLKEARQEKVGQPDNKFPRFRHNEDDVVVVAMEGKALCSTCLSNQCCLLTTECCCNQADKLITNYIHSRDGSILRNNQAEIVSNVNSYSEDGSIVGENQSEKLVLNKCYSRDGSTLRKEQSVKENSHDNSNRSSSFPNSKTGSNMKRIVRRLEEKSRDKEKTGDMVISQDMNKLVNIEKSQDMKKSEAVKISMERDKVRRECNRLSNAKELMQNITESRDPVILKSASKNAHLNFSHKNTSKSSDLSCNNWSTSSKRYPDIGCKNSSTNKNLNFRYKNSLSNENLILNTDKPQLKCSSILSATRQDRKTDKRTERMKYLLESGEFIDSVGCPSVEVGVACVDSGRANKMSDSISNTVDIAEENERRRYMTYQQAQRYVSEVRQLADQDLRLLCVD